MKSKLLGFVLGSAVGVAMLATAAPAFASVTPTNMLVNGDVHGSAPSGDVVNISVQEINTGVSTVQSYWVEIPGSGFPGECVDVLDENQVGAHTSNVNVNTLGTTEGDWTVSLRPYGFNRVTTGSQPTDVDCTNPQGAAHLFPNQLHITNPISTGNTSNNTGNGGVNGNGNGSGGTGVNNGNGNGGGSSDASVPAWFKLYLKASCTANGGTFEDTTLVCTSKVVTPPPPTGNDIKCSMIAPYRNAPSYQYSTMGQQLQNVLMLDDPHSIPLLDASIHQSGTVPLGYFGIQTHGALNMFDSKYGCHA